MGAASEKDDRRRGDTDDESASRPAPEDVRDEDDVDEASEESFPASDAPASWSGPPDG
jgi:hypothetical protein